MMATETKQYIRARIIADDSPESPREWSNLGTFVGAEHRSYNIGDRRPTEPEREALSRGGFALLARYLRRYEGATVVLPVGMLDHSGVTFYVGGGAHWSDSQGWDSGTCGYIFDTAEARAGVRRGRAARGGRNVRSMGARGRVRLRRGTSHALYSLRDTGPRGRRRRTTERMPALRD